MDYKIILHEDGTAERVDAPEPLTLIGTHGKEPRELFCPECDVKFKADITTCCPKCGVEGMMRVGGYWDTGSTAGKAFPYFPSVSTADDDRQVMERVCRTLEKLKNKEEQ